MAAPRSTPSPAPAGQAGTRVLASQWHTWAGAMRILWVPLGQCLGSAWGCPRPPGTSANPEHLLIADGC